MEGRKDALMGFTTVVWSPDSNFSDQSESYLAAVHTGMTSDQLSGMVYSITEKELKTIDAYETEAYLRVEVVLDSGIRSWVYVSAIDKRALN